MFCKKTGWFERESISLLEICAVFSQAPKPPLREPLSQVLFGGEGEHRLATTQVSCFPMAAGGGGKWGSGET